MRRIVYYNASKPSFRPFILTVDSGADSKFTIPTSGAGYNYRAKVAGVVDVSGLTGNYTINFPSANTDYVLEISGLFPRWYWYGNAKALQLRDIMQWGDIVWRSFAYSFWNAGNTTISATDLPNLTYVDGFVYAFAQTNFVYDFSTWNAPLVKSLSHCFFGSKYNGEIGSLINEKITDVQSMFGSAGFFNKSLLLSDTKNVTNMISFLQNAQAFNQEVSHLNVSKVQSLTLAFYRTFGMTKNIHFDDPITGSISNQSLNNTFYQTRCESVKLQCGNVVNSDQDCFAFSYISELELIDMKASFFINRTGSLTGAKIDQLANSVYDLTGMTTRNVVVSPTQYLTMNVSLFLDKNWSIVQAV